MKYIFALFSCFIFFSINAQVKIAYDVKACAYGLKNNENQWIVKPKYQSLQLFDNQFYLAEAGGKKGLINEKDETILEIRFDQISVFNTGKYLVSKTFQYDNFAEKKSGIINTAGQWLLPLEYFAIEKSNSGNYILIKSYYVQNKGIRYQSAVCDENFNLIFPFKNGYIANSFYTYKNMLIGDYPVGNFQVSGNVKLMDWQGNILTQDSFDLAAQCGENFTIIKNNRFGLMDAKGNILHPPNIFIDQRHRQYGNETICIHGDHRVFINENNKKGILNGSWEIIIPTEYSYLENINPSYEYYTKAGYIGLHADSKKYRLISKKGKVMYEADTVWSKALLLPKTNYYEQNKYDVFFIYKERKNKSLLYGILNAKGDKLTDSPTEFYYLENLGFMTLIQEKSAQPELKLISFSQNQTTVKSLSYINQVNEVSFFGNEEMIIPIKTYNQNNRKFIGLYGYTLPKDYGKYVLVSGNEAGFIYNKSNKTIEKVNYLNLNETRFPSIASNKSHNILHPVKGKLLPEGIIQINQQFAYNNRIWARKIDGKLQLYDTLGTLRTPIEFDEIAYQNDTAIMRLNGKYGLADHNFNWIYTPDYEQLFLVKPKFYIGILPDKNVAVLDLSKQTKKDIGYSDFCPLVANNQFKEFFYLLRKNNIEKVYNSKGEITTFEEKEIHTRNWLKNDAYIYNFVLQCPKEMYGFIDNHKHIIYDFMYPFYRKNVDNLPQTVINGMKMNGNYAVTYNFHIEFSDNKKLSTAVKENKRGEIYYDIDKFPYEKNSNEVIRKNWIKINGKYQEIDIENLITKNKSTFENIVFETISNTPNLKIDCSQPQAIIDGLNGFSFASTGITLHFFEGTVRHFQILIPKKDVTQFCGNKELLELMD